MSRLAIVGVVVGRRHSALRVCEQQSQCRIFGSQSLSLVVEQLQFSNSLGDVLGLVRVNVNVFVNVVVLTYIAETDEFLFTPNLMSRFYREGLGSH